MVLRLNGELCKPKIEDRVHNALTYEPCNILGYILLLLIIIIVIIDDVHKSYE